MRRQSFDDELKKLRSMARAPLTDEVVDTLRSALRNSQATLAALAAQIAGHRRIADLTPDLVRAFDRFMDSPDKVCQAKIVIASALNRLDSSADEVYLRGVKHVQMEPAFGGPIDVAADLRAECAVALVNMRHPKAATELTNLLVDKEINPRRAAVRGLAQVGTEGAELVIRLKVLVGDSEPEVLGECFAALITLATDSLPFVGGFLDSPNPDVAEQAAMVLGQSHEAEAFEILRRSWEDNVNPSFRRMLLLPISLMRRDDAFDFLLGIVENGGMKLAAETVSTLRVYADDRSRRKIHDAVERRDDPLVSQVFEREFGDNG